MSPEEMMKPKNDCQRRRREGEREQQKKKKKDGGKKKNDRLFFGVVGKRVDEGKISRSMMAIEG